MAASKRLYDDIAQSIRWTREDFPDSNELITTVLAGCVWILLTIILILSVNSLLRLVG